MTEEVTNLIADEMRKLILTTLDANTDQARLSGYGDVSFTTDIEELADIVARAVLERSAAQTTEAKAEAWDEGFDAYEDWWDNSKVMSTPLNPYRPVAVVPEDPKPCGAFGGIVTAIDKSQGSMNVCTFPAGHPGAHSWDHNGVTPKAGA